MLDGTQNPSMIDRERLFDLLEGSRKLLLSEPQALLTAASRLSRLDGRRCRRAMTIPSSYTWCIPMIQPEPGLTIAAAEQAWVV